MTVCHTPPAFGCDGCVRRSTGASYDPDADLADPVDAEIARSAAELGRAEQRISMLRETLSQAYAEGMAQRTRADRLHALLRRVLIHAPRCGECDQPATHVGTVVDVALACEWHAARNHTELSLDYSAVLRDAKAELRRKDTP